MWLLEAIWKGMSDRLLECLTFLAILVALFGKEFLEWLKRPHLKIGNFNEQDKSYFHSIHFPLGYKSGGHEHYSKGINTLLKISNPQEHKVWFIRTGIAKNVEAKITHIDGEDETFIYHPTPLNWSGGNPDNPMPVSIIPGSHHFLDFIRFYNYQDDLWIIDPETGKWKKSAIKAGKVSPPLPEERVYFEPWVPQRYGGIARRFTTDGTYKIYFVINGENCGPYKYIATVKWSKSRWDKPEIQIDPE